MNIALSIQKMHLAKKRNRPDLQIVDSLGDFLFLLDEETI